MVALPSPATAFSTTRRPICSDCPAIARVRFATSTRSGVVAPARVSTATVTPAPDSPSAGIAKVASSSATSPAGVIEKLPLTLETATAPPRFSAASVMVSLTSAPTIEKPKSPVSDWPAKARVASLTVKEASGPVKTTGMPGSLLPGMLRVSLTAPPVVLTRTLVAPVMATPGTPMIDTFPLATRA